LQYRAIHILLIAAFFGTCFPGLSQTLNDRLYDEQDGLPSQQVFSMAQDYRGYLWFITQGGTAVYDGVRWSYPPDSVNLHSSRYASIAAMPDSSVWSAGLNQDGIFTITKLKSGAYSIFQLPQDRFGGALRILDIHFHFAKDRTVDIYFSSRAKAYRFSERDNSWEMVSTPDKALIGSSYVFEDKWVLSTTKGLYYAEGPTHQKVQLPNSKAFPSQDIRRIMYSQTGDSLYVLGYDWLGISTPSGFKLLLKDHQDKAQSSFWRHELIVHPKYPMVFTINGEQYVNHPKRGILPIVSDHLQRQYVRNQAFVDRQCNLWVCTDRGAIKISSLAFLNYYFTNDPTQNEVSTLLEISPGRFFVGGNTDLKIVENNRTVYSERLMPQKGFFRVLDAAKSPKGEVYFSCVERGLLKFNPETLTTTDLAIGGQSTALTFRGDTLFYIKSTNSKYRSIGTSLVTSLNGKVLKSIPITGVQIVRRIIFDKNGRLLLLTDQGLLNREGSAVLKYGKNPSFRNNFYSYCEYKGKMVLGTMSGLYTLSGDSLQPFRVEIGNPNVSVYALTVSLKGHLWAGTNKGVWIYHPATGWRNLNTEDGLSSNETNRRALTYSTRGQMLIGTSRGLSVYQPEFDLPKRQPPIVTFQRVIVDDLNKRPLRYSNAFSYGQTLEFHFTAASFVHEEKLEYEYRLNGFESDWNRIKGNPTANRPRYNNIDAGSYFFEVRAKESDGAWSPVVRSPVITVSPPFYKTLYFQLSVLLLIGGVGYLVRAFITSERNKQYLRAKVAEKTQEIQQSEQELKAQNERLEKTNSELDSFVYRVSHDLRAPISSALGLISLIEISDTEAEREQYIELLQQSMYRIDTFIKDILVLSRNSRTDISVEPVDFNQMVWEIFEQHAYDEDAKSVEQLMEIQVTEAFYSDKLRIKFILNNLITNAIRYHNPYHKHPWVKVAIRSTEQGVEICVSDNGLGIKEEQQAKVFDMFYRASSDKTGSGLGLYIVKETADKLRGSVHLSSDFGKGSNFTVNLPNLGVGREVPLPKS